MLEWLNSEILQIKQIYYSENNLFLKMVAGSKGWGQLLVYGQLQRPWLLACTTMAAGSYRGLMAMEAGDGDWARGMQAH